MDLSKALPVLAGVSLTIHGSGTEAAPKPNIVCFMVDDLGWNHIGVPKGTMDTADAVYETPNLRKLAAQGLCFTHAYTQPNCAPTRAAMLSGQYPARIHNGVYVVGNLNRFGKGGIREEDARFKGPAQSQDVAPKAVTVGEALQQNGYTTAHIGKYHVGGHRGKDTLPENVGYDINLGGCAQGHQPVCFAAESDGTWAFKSLGRGDFDRYASPYSEAYIEKRKLPESLLGTPKHISDALGDALEETVSKLGTGDKPFYLQFHTYAVHGPVRSRPDLKQAATKRVGKGTSKRAEYVGFVAGVDENMGRLLAVLDDPNGDGDTSDSILANTLILFTSDNGGTHASNAPLRGKKGMFTEGGIRVPLIAAWPGVIPANTVTDHVVHSIDYYPTYLELAGEAWSPPEAKHPLDGESFADILRDPDTDRSRKPLFFLFPGYLDKRAQPCLVAIADMDGERLKLHYDYETNAWSLYCLSADQSEANDILQDRPDVAATLSHQMDAWLRQTHPTWKPAFPILKETNEPAGPPPVL